MLHVLAGTFICQSKLNKIVYIFSELADVLWFNSLHVVIVPVGSVYCF
uniref:Uncharacterized protein n=1 Tax=Anguilla anguilla TaxID=7936 RepID=A0A0E9UYI0_ANGAN